MVLSARHHHHHSHQQAREHDWLPNREILVAVLLLGEGQFDITIITTLSNSYLVTNLGKIRCHQMTSAIFCWDPFSKYNNVKHVWLCGYK